MGIVVILMKFGLSDENANVIGYLTSPAPIGFLLFVFLNSCPQCEKNFYVWSPLGPSNPFTKKCLNCGLSWDLLNK
jgi:hypothetical protein